MEQNEEVKQDTQYLYYRVAVDSTRWDKMTGNELKRRIKSLLADQESLQKTKKNTPFRFLLHRKGKCCLFLRRNRKLKMRNTKSTPSNQPHIPHL